LNSSNLDQLALEGLMAGECKPSSAIL